MKRLYIALACLAAIGTNHVSAKSLGLEKIDQDLETYLQKTLSPADAACFAHIFHKLVPQDAYKEYYLTYEDEGQISAVEIGDYDSSALYTCVSGKLLSWDTGESTVLKDFN